MTCIKACSRKKLTDFGQNLKISSIQDLCEFLHQSLFLGKKSSISPKIEIIAVRVPQGNSYRIMTLLFGLVNFQIVSRNSYFRSKWPEKSSG